MATPFLGVETEDTITLCVQWRTLVKPSPNDSGKSRVFFANSPRLPETRLSTFFLSLSH